MKKPTNPAAIKDLGRRFIRVNHAGENGAVHIYTGQLFMARFTARSMRSELAEFRAHEMRHRAIFGAELLRRGQRRCPSYWLCGLGGLVLGLITGLLGVGAIAATTVAVEGVVLRHLQQQLIALGEHDPNAVAAISSIIAEEQEHHDRSEDWASTGSFWPKVIAPIVRASTEAVIWLGMRT